MDITAIYSSVCLYGPVPSCCPWEVGIGSPLVRESRKVTFALFLLLYIKLFVGVNQGR